MGSWLIKQATVVTMDDEGRVLPKADLLIQDTEIAGLWPSDHAAVAARLRQALGYAHVPAASLLS